MKEILIIRWKSIGDVVFTLPAVNCIRANFPDAHLTFLVSRENAFVVEGFSAIDRIWTIDRALLRGPRFLQGIGAVAKLLLRIRRQRFSLVVDLQGYGETALISWISGAEDRWGRARKGFRRRIYTRNLIPGASCHPAESHLELLAQGGLRRTPVDNRFRIEPRHVEVATTHLDRQGIRKGVPLVYFQPCTSAVEKNWPIHRYIEVATHLHRRGMQVIFGGGPGDQDAFDAARGAGFAVTDGLPAAACVALLGRADLVIGGDTGFLHLAVAAGTPVLMVARRGPLPLGHPEWALLAPQGRIDEITVAQVIERAEARLAAVIARTPARSPLAMNGQ